MAALALCYNIQMKDYRHGSHTAFSIHLHIVWITKYRKKILTKEIATFVRDVIRKECNKQKVDILKGNISKDHVHVMVSIPPQLSISRLVQRLKGKSSYLVLSKFSQLEKVYWGRHFWARGYFVRSSGNLTDEIIKNYIEKQSHNDDNFKI